MGGGGGGGGGGVGGLLIDYTTSARQVDLHTSRI